MRYQLNGDRTDSCDFDVDGFKGAFAARLDETYKRGWKVLFVNLLDIPLAR